jgi:hypothetical protein
LKQLAGVSDSTQQPEDLVGCEVRHRILWRHGGEAILL